MPRLLERVLPWLDDIVRAKRPMRVPLVLTVDEVAALLNHLHGVHWLVHRCSTARGCT